MAIRVECYSGYRGDEEPRAFWLGTRRLAVRAIVDRWFAPTQRWFRVDADDGNVYVLRFDESKLACGRKFASPQAAESANTSRSGASPRAASQVIESAGPAST